MDWKVRTYGRIKGGEIERCLSMFKEIWAERTSWQSSKNDEEQWIDSVQKLIKVPNWTVFYQDDLKTLLAKLIAVTGLSEAVVEALKSEDPAHRLFDSLATLPDEPPEHPASLPLAFAMVGNLDAIARYSRTINDMFEAAKKGDISSLFVALSVDSMISTMPFFQAALRLGQLSGDATAAEEMFKTIKGPHKKRLAYPELRWTEYLLRDQGAFHECTKEEIYKLVVEHLRVYDVKGAKDDSKAALFKLFKTWQKEAGIQNPRFGFSGKKKT